MRSGIGSFKWPCSAALRAAASIAISLKFYFEVLAAKADHGFATITKVPGSG